MKYITYGAPGSGSGIVEAACGIERWNQRAVDIAKVMRKHPVVVSRWVSEAGRIRNEDNGFAKDLDALDQAISDLAIERLAEIRAAERESQDVSPGTDPDRGRMTRSHRLGKVAMNSSSTWLNRSG